MNIKTDNITLKRISLIIVLALLISKLLEMLLDWMIGDGEITIIGYLQVLLIGFIKFDNIEYTLDKHKCVFPKSKINLH